MNRSPAGPITRPILHGPSTIVDCNLSIIRHVDAFLFDLTRVLVSNICEVDGVRRRAHTALSCEMALFRRCRFVCSCNHCSNSGRWPTILRMLRYILSVVIGRAMVRAARGRPITRTAHQFGAWLLISAIFMPSTPCDILSYGS